MSLIRPQFCPRQNPSTKLWMVDNPMNSENLAPVRQNKSKQIWDAFILLMTVVAAIETPLRLAFKLPMEGALFFIDSFITATFVIDMMLSFFLPVLVNGQLVTSRKSIASHYLKGWFLIDLLAIFPWTLILGASWEWAKLLRLLRLAHIASFMQKIAKANIINASFLRMFILAFWVALFAHWATCGWVALGAGNIGPEWHAEKNLLYLRSFYWAVTTIATIGYGDVTPITPPQTMFAILIEIMGAGFYGYVIAIFAGLISNLDAARKKFTEQIDEINTFMRFRKIPPNLQNQIRGYYDYLWESRRGHNEAHVLADLPPSLKLKVSIFINQAMLEKVPIFEGAGEALVKELVLHLKPIILTPSDYVFQAGDEGDSMYFISSGRVEIISADGNTVFATLSAGSYFGEMALILIQPRSASARALDYVDLYSLEKNTFEKILQKFPAFQEHLHELVLQRQSGTKK
jgi:voltage-gated potassium channel